MIGETPDDRRPADRAPVPDDETAERLRRLLFGGRRRRTTCVEVEEDERTVADAASEVDA